MPRKTITTAKTPLDEAIAKLKTLVYAEPEVNVADGLDKCADAFATVRRRQAALKAISAQLTREADRLSFEVLPDVFEHTHTVSPYNHASGKLTLATRVTVKLLDKDRSIEWLKGNGLEDIVIETVPWQTIAAVASDRIKNGEPDFPKDLFETDSRVYTRFQKPGEE